MEKSSPEEPNPIINDDSLRPDQINGAPPLNPMDATERLGLIIAIAYGLMNLFFCALLFAALVLVIFLGVAFGIAVVVTLF